MEDTTLKFLYETTVKKVVEEPHVVTKTEGGATIETTTTVKKVKPVKFAVLRPDRKLYKGAEIFYAKALAEYLKAGLLPYSLVKKRYANDGGPLTDEENISLKALTLEATKLEREFFTAPAETQEQKDKKNEILIRINNINLEVSAIQNAYADIFDSTAEMKARNDSIEWWVLHLMYVETDGKFVPFFGAGTYDEKVKALEGFEDLNDPYVLEAIKKLSYLVSFWFASRDGVTKVDFQTIEQLYTDKVSTYKVAESEDLKIVDKTPEPPKEVAPATEFSRQGLSAEETLKRTSEALTLSRLSGEESVKSVTEPVKT